MRRARITYQGAFHHVMNRGIDGLGIFIEESLKDKFLEIVSEKQKKLRIRLFAYCIMDNHFHLILENSSGRISDFMKQVGGQFASFYRRLAGGRGYVFQDRFKSILIQDTSYLQMAIIYVLRNPIRAGVTSSFERYKWSSGKFYFSDKKSPLLDADFVEDLFGYPLQLRESIQSEKNDELPLVKTKYGTILGTKHFVKTALKKFDRRGGEESTDRKRVNDKHFEPIEKILREFENIHDISIDNINVRTYGGKRLRGELLILLKDLGGLKYSEIIKLDLFSDVQMNSLASLYKNAVDSQK
jgi:REP element-mobilizing transposase RayT